MTTYGLTNDGFVVKRLQDIKTELEDAYRDAFGNVDTDPDSFFGQVIGIGADRESTLWELMELIYLSQSPDSAEGVNLDNAVGYVGLERLPATKSTANVLLYTDDMLLLPVTVPALTEVEVRGAGDVLELAEATDITASTVIDSTMEVVTATNGVEYKVTINGTDFTYLAGGGDTVLTIATGLVTAINLGAEPATAVDNGDGTFQLTADKVDNVRTVYTLAVTTDGVGTELEISELGSPSLFTAQVAGATPVPAGTMTEIVNPVSGLSRTDNLDAGTTGTEAETDTALRVRRDESLQVAGAATLAAIRSRLLNDVDDVTAVSIAENRTDAPVGGLPAHSFECVVTGGDEQEIAQKIWDTKPAGIETEGSITKQVTDTNGDSQDVKFSRSMPMYAWVKVRYSVYAEENYPGETTAVQAIKDSLLAFGQAFELGEDMIRDRFYGPCFAAEGIGTIDTLEIDLTPNPGDTPAYSTSNEPVAADEIALFAEVRFDVAET